jgi:glucose-6-phosphate 1-epimerase
MALWPHAFRLEFIVRIAGARLDMQMRVANAGDAGFDFAAALHTYFRVPDAAATRLHGLQGTRYVNRGSDAVDVESREIVTAIEPIDRVYFGAPARLRLETAGRALRIEQRGFTDTVVWNPGIERTARMADMPPEGFRHMLCVEAAAVEPRIVLAPGAMWTGVQAIEARPG